MSAPQSVCALGIAVIATHVTDTQLPPRKRPSVPQIISPTGAKPSLHVYAHRSPVVPWQGLRCRLSLLLFGTKVPWSQGMGWHEPPEKCPDSPHTWMPDARYPSSHTKLHWSPVTPSQTSGSALQTRHWRHRSWEYIQGQLTSRVHSPSVPQVYVFATSPPRKPSLQVARHGSPLYRPCPHKKPSRAGQAAHSRTTLGWHARTSSKRSEESQIVWKCLPLAPVYPSLQV